MAAHASASGGTPSCNLFFLRQCRTAGPCGAGGSGAANALCTIDGADGLPVELMDFSVEDEAEATPEASEKGASD